MQHKITLVTDAQGIEVIAAVKTALNIVFDNGTVNITETAQLPTGHELQRSTISLMQTPDADLNALTQAFIDGVFTLYEPYRKAVSAIRTSINPSDF